MGLSLLPDFFRFYQETLVKIQFSWVSVRISLDKHINADTLPSINSHFWYLRIENYIWEAREGTSFHISWIPLALASVQSDVLCYLVRMGTCYLCLRLSLFSVAFWCCTNEVAFGAHGSLGGGICLWMLHVMYCISHAWWQGSTRNIQWATLFPPD